MGRRIRTRTQWTVKMRRSDAHDVRWVCLTVTHIRRTTLGLEVNAEASCSTPSGLMPSSVRLGETRTENADAGGGDQRPCQSRRCTPGCYGVAIDRDVKKSTETKRRRKISISVSAQHDLRGTSLTCQCVVEVVTSETVLGVQVPVVHVRAATGLTPRA